MSDVRRAGSTDARCPACGVGLFRNPPVRCRACRAFVLAKPRSNEESVSAHRRAYFDEGRLYDMSPAQLINQYLQFIDSRKPLHGADVLDFGCGNAPTPALVAERGGCYVGVDSSAEAVAAQRREDVEAYTSLASLDSDRRFDIILMMEVVEHLDSPREIMAQLRGLLKAEGAVFLSTPNEAGLKSRILRTRWSQARNPTHVCLYNAKALNRLLRATGFEAIGEMRRVHFPGRRKWAHVIHSVLQALRLDGGLRVLAVRTAGSGTAASHG
jgi:2-polyprenyl-3-methyl-5-hydroxy-6-metoxy-1,4-benzoquinol methylase